jgi:hypothetical protein
VGRNAAVANHSSLASSEGGDQAEARRAARWLRLAGRHVRGELSKKLAAKPNSDGLLRAAVRRLLRPFRTTLSGYASAVFLSRVGLHLTLLFAS